MSRIPLNNDEWNEKLTAEVEVGNESIDPESDSSTVKSLDNIFKDPVAREYYEKVYEDSGYECRHLLDSEITWTPKEEKKILLKNDWYVTFWAFIMFTALDFDRYNIKQALSDNLLNDLHLTTGDYNVGNTINLVCFFASELPSQLISKKLGADIWIPIQICLWSIVAITQSSMTSRGGFLATRALVGLLEGGFICDVCLWMSYFYTSKELPFRLSLFYIANPLTNVWSSLLAFALLKVKTNSIQQGWRWLFLIEGLVTLLVGLISFFKMPPSVAQTKTWYRKKGWYTPREEKILVNKILRDDPSKGDMNNRTPVGPKELFKALTNFDLYPIYFVRLLGDIGNSPVSNYMTLTLRKLGFSTFKTNALTIPSSILSIVTMLITGYLSEVVNDRALVLATIPVWILSGLFPLRYWPGSGKNVWGTWVLLTIILGSSPTWAISISWCSANSNSVRDRAVSAAVVNIYSQIASIIAANMYQPDDAPYYHKGNEALIGCAFGAIAACVFARYYYKYRNSQKQKKWNGLTDEEKEDYIRNTTDFGTRRLDFRFVY